MPLSFQLIYLPGHDDTILRCNSNKTSDYTMWPLRVYNRTDKDCISHQTMFLVWKFECEPISQKWPQKGDPYLSCSSSAGEAFKSAKTENHMPFRTFKSRFIVFSSISLFATESSFKLGRLKLLESDTGAFLSLA